MASSSLEYFVTCLLITTTVVLFDNTNIVSCQSHIWAEDQPSSAYTIYNGKVYPVPKKESSWSNLFSFETLYNNPVVQTVLGWTDSFYGGGGATFENDTIGDSPDALSASSSHSHHAYAGQPNQQQFPQYPYNGNGYYKNGMGNQPEKYQPNYNMQQQPQQPGLNNNGKYPSYPYGSAPQYPLYPQQQQQQQQPPQQQQPQPIYRPSPEQQLYQQKQLQYQQQLYPQQFPSSFGSAPYSQQQQQPFYGANYGVPNYGNPNLEIVNQLEAQGSMETIMTVQPQERHYQSSNYQPHQSIQPNLAMPSAKNSFDSDLNDKPNSDSSTEAVKEESSTSVSSSSSGDMLDDYPCPPLNQWKWDGELCIALGPYPTWACRPNDLVASGRVTICRNKIFFPNEP